MKRITLSLLALVFYTTTTQAQVLIETIEEDWKGDTAWVNYARDTFEYDWNLNVTVDRSYGWNSLQSSWNEGVRTTNTYNGLLLIESFYSLINHITNEAANYKLTQYIYNSNDQLETTFYYRWINDNFWRREIKIDLIYDNDGNLAERWQSTWFFSDSTWHINNRTLYIYNNSGILTQTYLQDWYYSTNSWGDYLYRTTYDYDGNDQKIHELGEGFNNGNWQASYQREYTYDSNGNLIKTVWDDWNYFNQDWEPYKLIESTYNLDNTIHQTITQSWSEIDSILHNDSRLTYYYDNIQGVEDVERNTLSIYPNPSSDVITVGFMEEGLATTNVFDARGRLVVSQTALGNKDVIDVKPLSAGTYFINVLQDGKQYTGSFIKN